MNPDIVYSLLFALARSLQQTTLVGNPTRYVKELFERISKPQPGDWVVEASTIYRQNRMGIGRLICVRSEPIPGEWDEKDSPRPMDDIWHVETLEGQHVRWNNCSFTALPNNPPTFDSPVESSFYTFEEMARWTLEAMKRHKLGSP